MSSSPSAVRTGYVIRGGGEGRVRPARMGTQLATTQFTSPGVADPRLVDPLLEEVVARACEEARREGFEAGRVAGFEAGRAEGLELMAAEQAQLVERDAAERSARRERLMQLLAGVEDAVVGALDYQAPNVEELRDLVAGTAVEIAEALVGHHLTIEDCAAKDALLRALSMVPRRARIVVRMHPEDVALVEEFSGQITEWQIAQLVPDLAVERGDAYAEADNLEVEASIAGALERVHQVLHP